MDDEITPDDLQRLIQTVNVTAVLVGQVAEVFARLAEFEPPSAEFLERLALAGQRGADAGRAARDSFLLVDWNAPPHLADVDWRAPHERVDWNNPAS